MIGIISFFHHLLLEDAEQGNAKYVVLQYEQVIEHLMFKSCSTILHLYDNRKNISHGFGFQLNEMGLNKDVGLLVSCFSSKMEIAIYHSKFGERKFE